MAELIATSNGLRMSITALTGAIGIAVVILSIGVAVASMIYTVTRYADVDFSIEIRLQEVIPAYDQVFA
jgi:hypothetical protein